MRRAFTLYALIVGLTLAGCGGGSTTTGGSSSTTTTGGSGGATAAGVAVAMKDIAFAPRTIRVKVGQRITWTNDDTVAHNVTAQSGASFRSSDFSQGGTFSYTPAKAGTIAYVCTIHPGMDGTIAVAR